MDSRFNKYVKLIEQKELSKDLIKEALNELHKTFATLTQEEQKYANIFLHDIQRGDIQIEEGKTLRDYIMEYQYQVKNAQIQCLVEIFGLEEEKLRNMMGLNLTEANINEFGRFDELKRTIDKVKAKAFFEEKEHSNLNLPKVNIRTDKLLRKFILSGGFEIEQSEKS